MTKINLRECYPNFYTRDYIIEVTDEVANVFLLASRQENNNRLRTYRNKAYYSLDSDDGIENDVLYREPSPEEIYFRKVSLEQLQDALDRLPPIQARRVYAHYILGLKKVDIARSEGVNSGGVCDSVRKGVKNLRRYFEKKRWIE